MLVLSRKANKDYDLLNKKSKKHLQEAKHTLDTTYHKKSDLNHYCFSQNMNSKMPYKV